MEWCGWSVLPIDWAISPQHDLHDADLQAHLLQIVGKVDMWMVAMDCSTFSRARERPIPGHKTPPQPLRDARHPEGLPDLAPREKDRVEKANNLVSFFCQLLAAAHKAGAAGALENPRRAWIWELPQVQALLQLPWSDFDYTACSLGGARAKAQRIRSSVSELKAVCCSCYHNHDPDEWKPRWDAQTKSWVYPSAEEQEYTAELAFNIAVAASAWACRVGRAQLRIPRPPKPCETGSRVEWLAFQPSLSRADAMPGIATRMGLTPPGRLASVLPSLSRTQAMEGVPEGGVYIGQGNLRLRLSKSKWASPFRPGPHGTPEACVRKYAHWLLGQPALLMDLPQLRAKKLLCDCPLDEPCHGEALVTAVFNLDKHTQQQRAPQQPQQPPAARSKTWPHQQRQEKGPPTTGAGTLCVLEPRQKQAAPRKPRKAVTLVAAAALTAARAQGASLDLQAPARLTRGALTLRWSQQSLDATVRKLFPAEWTQGFSMPNLEDLLNAPPYTSFQDWLQENGISDPGGGTWARAASSGWRAAALGQQRGAIHSAGQLEPLIGFGLSKEDHLKQAILLARTGQTPWTETAASDYDLRFAAAALVANRDHLRSHRQNTRKAFAELADRCAPLSERLRKFQTPTVQRIAGGIHVGLVAVLVAVMAWPDYNLPRRFIEGFQVVGELERTNVYEAQQLPAPLPKADLLAASPSLIRSIEAERPHEEVDFIWESCLKEYKKGFAETPQPREALDARYGVGGWSPVPSFCIVQSCGKKRRIDNGRRGGQNAATAYSEKQRMCSAFQPGLHARLVTEEAATAGLDMLQEGLELESGGEDLPDAFRSIPCRPADLDINIVAARHPTTGVMYYQQVDAMLFGFSCSVIQFGRWSRFLESFSRRILALLWSMYVDDSTLTDAAKAKGAGQQLAGYAFARIGTPFAPVKQHLMAPSGCFLGVNHDLSMVALKGIVAFEPSAKLLEKALTQLEEMAATNCCTPAMASKFRGTAGFCAHAFWGRVGRAGFGPFRQRQYSDTEPWTLSNSLARSIEYFRVILSQAPRRLLQCSSAKEPLVVIASDAQADPGSQPGCGYMLFDARDGRRAAACCPLAEELLDAWGYGTAVRQEGGNPIAICEAAVIAAAALAEAPTLAGRTVVWFVDNTTALHAFVKGTSANEAVERAAQCVHFLSLKYDFRIWFEFIDSGANWSDGISRELHDDQFAKDHGFRVSTLAVPLQLWSCDLVSLWAGLAA